MTMTQEFVKVRKAATFCGVSEATIRAGIKSGKIKGDLVGGRYVVSLEWLRRLNGASEDRPQAA